MTYFNATVSYAARRAHTTSAVTKDTEN